MCEDIHMVGGQFVGGIEGNVDLPFCVRIQERLEGQGLGEDLAEVIIGEIRHIFHIGVLGDDFDIHGSP